MLIAAVLTATAMSLKLPRLLTQELCSSGESPATSLGAFDGAAQGPQAWASKSAYELTQNTKTTGYGDAGQYVKSATCKLSATTCGAGYTHDDYALAKKQTGAVDAACVKCAAGKWVRPEITKGTVQDGFLVQDGRRAGGSGGGGWGFGRRLGAYERSGYSVAGRWGGELGRRREGNA